MSAGSVEIIEQKESSNKKIVFSLEKLGGLFIIDKINNKRFYLQPSEVRDLRALLLKSEYYRINDLLKVAIDEINANRYIESFFNYLHENHRTIFYLLRDRLVQYGARHFGLNIPPEEIHVLLDMVEENFYFSDFLLWLQDEDLALHELVKEPIVLFWHEFLKR